MDESYHNMITEPQFKGNVGMFLVCAELSKYNLIAMPTSRNTKGCDIVVLNPDTNNMLPIQVKCTDKRDFPIFSSYWKDYEPKIESKILADFIFVDISSPDKPNYFIVSEKEMKDILKSKINLWAHQYQKRKTYNWEQMLEEEEREKRNTKPWTLKLCDIEDYRDKWGTIINRL